MGYPFFSGQRLQIFLVACDIIRSSQCEDFYRIISQHLCFQRRGIIRSSYCFQMNCHPRILRFILLNGCLQRIADLIFILEDIHYHLVSRAGIRTVSTLTFAISAAGEHTGDHHRCKDTSHYFLFHKLFTSFACPACFPYITLSLFFVWLCT